MKIEEIILEWDWENIAIPSKNIKRIEYDNPKNCKNVLLEIDLKYIKEQKIIEKVQNQNIWSIQIKYKNNNNISLTLPSYRKDNYCSENKVFNEWENKNLCEHHQEKENTYIIEWHEIEEKEANMNYEEMKIFFKKDNLINICNLKNNLEIEIFKRILNNPKIEKEGLSINYILIPKTYKKNQLDQLIYEIEQKQKAEKNVLIVNDNINIEQLIKDLCNKKSDNLVVTSYSKINKIWYNIHKEWNLL